MQAILASLALVTASEMGDKTQLLALSLATRFRRPWPIMAGILTATIFNHTLASEVGSWVSAHVPPRVMALILAATFIAFGLWTLRPDSLKENNRPSRFGPYLTTTVLFFFAEMGDKTQLATVALAAEFKSVALVTVGTTMGMLLSDGLAVFLGEKLAHRISMTWLRRGAATLFFIFGTAAGLDGLRDQAPALPGGASRGAEQLVLMSVRPGEELGEEVHDDSDQFFRVEAGEGELVIDGVRHRMAADFAMLVPAGARHTVRNVGQEPMKLYTLYAPPEHRR